MDLTDRIFVKMTEYENSPKRIQHFIKVWALSRFIGRREGLSPRLMEILEAAALTHDIGIKPALEKYNSSAGKYQEAEGPSAAERLLSELTEDRELIDEVCFIIGNHHSYLDDCPITLRIIYEADFIVNAYEDGLDIEAVRHAEKKFFRTTEGTRILREMYYKR